MTFILEEMKLELTLSEILVDTAEAAGLVNRTGAWYQLDDGTKVQGRDGFIARVKKILTYTKLKDKLING
jgi:hypothetical protein